MKKLLNQSISSNKKLNFKKDKFSDEVTDYVDLEPFIDSINNGTSLSYLTPK